MGPLHRNRIVLAGLALSLTAAVGCSRDDDKADKADTDTPATTVAAEVAESKDFELDAPVHIVALISDPSNSADPNAVPDFNDGARLAIEEINEAGGIGGQDIEFTAIDTPPVGDEVVNAFNLGLESDPTVMVGPVSSTASLAISGPIAKEGIPLIHNSTDGNLATDGEGGNEWVFASRPRNDEAAQIGARFLVEELGAEKVGLIGINAAFGQQGFDAAHEAIPDNIGTERSFEYNATNLTEPIQAMDGMDAIFDWGTPNTLSATIVTAGQQGLDIPHMGPGSVGFASFRDSVGDDELLENVYGVVDCNPLDDDRQHVQEWADRFEARFGYEPSYSAAELYDTVYILRTIIEEKESADPGDVRDGLENLLYEDGICARTYQNVDGFLTQESTIGRYDDGEFVTVERYSTAD